MVDLLLGFDTGCAGDPDHSTHWSCGHHALRTQVAQPHSTAAGGRTKVSITSVIPEMGP